MQFCPKCGCVMIGDGENSKCQRCGHQSKEKINLQASENIKIKSAIAVVNEEDSNYMPITENTCPKCENKEAYFWTRQTRAGDEAETKFFKCTKCKHIWRVYK